MLAEPVSRRVGSAPTAVAAACLLGGNLLIPLAAGPRWIAIAVIATGGFSVGLGVVYLIILRATLVHRTVHYGLLGRVGSVMRLIEWGPGPFGAAIGGLLGQVLGLRPALVILGVGCLLGVPWIAVAAFRGHLSSVQR